MNVGKSRHFLVPCKVKHWTSTTSLFIRFPLPQKHRLWIIICANQVHSSNLHQVDPPLGNYPGKSKSRKQPSLLTLLNLTTQCGFILVKTNKMNEFDLASHRVRVSKSVPLAYLSSVHLNQVRNKLPSNLSTESWTMTSRKATSLATQNFPCNTDTGRTTATQTQEDNRQLSGLAQTHRRFLPIGDTGNKFSNAGETKS
jgi:hypothetical protein